MARLEVKVGSRLDRLHRTQGMLLTLKSKGFNYGWTARQLQVSRALVSMWKAGKAVPQQMHVAALTHLADSVLSQR